MVETEKICSRQATHQGLLFTNDGLTSSLTDKHHRQSVCGILVRERLF